MSTLFETATRIKLRYATEVGNISTEELWDLPLESNNKPSLDKVAMTISEELVAAGKKSFVKANKKDEVIELKLDIVKHIIAIKLDDIEVRKIDNERKDRKGLLIDVLAEKEIDELKSKSFKEIRKELKRL